MVLCAIRVLVQVLGVSPIEGFDMVKAAYARRRKDAERRGDEAALAQVVYARQSLSYLLSFCPCVIVVRSEHSK